MLAAERKILEALAETLIVKTETLPTRPTEIGITERIDRHLSFLSKNLRLVFRLVLFLFEGGGLPFRGRVFSKLSPERRERYLQTWQNHWFYPVRLLVKLLESTIYLNFYSHPEINRRIGFVQPPVRTEEKPPVLMSPPEQDLFLMADVCVIGSGAGGAVVAKELAQKGRSVVVLEEGGWFGLNDFGKEALEIVQKVYTSSGLQVGIGLPCILIPTGRAIGGTTVINSGTCFRLPDKVLLRWQGEFGLSNLTPEVLGPYFEKVERELHVTPVTEEVLGNNARIFRRGLEKLGLQGQVLHRNVQDCRGSGMCCFGCPTNAKQSVQLSYIPQAVQKGAKIFPRCRVESIFLKQEHGGEVVGRFPEVNGGGGKTIRVEARVIVLAAGTLNTPRLLRKNQIVLFNRHIGRHLTIHPAAKAAALFDEEVKGWEGVPQGYSYHGMASEGVLFEGVFTPPSYGSVPFDLPPKLHKEMMENYRHLASFGFMVSDEGRGWIRWLPNGDPIIYYSLRRREVQKFLKAFRFLTEIFLAAGARKVFTGIRKFPVVTKEDGIKAFDSIHLKRTDLQLAAFHPLGTCRMGADPSQSVVNSWGEVHFTKNLFIADGSIFPSPLGVNPQVTIMAFATRIAEFIHEERL